MVRLFGRSRLGWVSVCMAIAACGSGGDGAGTPQPSLVVSPTSQSVTAGQGTVQISATLAGSSSAISWAVTEADGGTVSPSSGANTTYTPPAFAAAARTATVVATAGSLTAQTAISISPGGKQLVVAPSAAQTVTAGQAGTLAFTATLTGATDPITWALSGTGVGTLSTASGATTTYSPPAFVAAATSTTLTATAGSLSVQVAIAINAGGKQLVVTPNGAQTVTAGQGTLSFTAVLSGATDPINWSVSGGVGSVSPGTGASTTYTPPAVQVSAVDTTLTVTAGSLTVSIPIHVSPTPAITVHGKVLDQDGQPVPNAPVSIGSSITATAADGSYAVSGVIVPYDVIVAVDPNNRKLAVIYEGLTRTDPTIYALHANLAQSNSRKATVTGNVQPLSATEVTYLTFWTPHSVKAIQVNPDAAGDFTVDVKWLGPASTTVSVHALRWKMDTGGKLPVAYTRFAELTNIAISDQGTKTGTNLTLAPLSATKSISGSVNLPPNYSVESYTVSVRFATGAPMQLLNEDVYSNTSLGASFVYNTPPLLNATAEVRVRAVDPDYEGSVFTKAGLPLDASSTAIDIRAAPVALTPIDAGTAITNTHMFTWTTFTGGVHMLDVEPSGGFGTEAEYHIVTARGNATLVDLTALGMPLPAAYGYSWVVDSYAPFGSVDEAAGPKGLSGAAATGWSRTRTFTTK
jgi:hypothetical protein